MRKVPARLLAVLPLLLGFVAFGCNGGSSSSSNPAITITLEPSGAQTMDQGQTLTIVATVANDSSNKGVTWSLTGAGSLSSQTAFSVNYVAPATVSSATTVTVTATSVADTTVTAKLTITVNPVTALTITTTSLPNGTVGVPYSTQLQAFGGTSPYTWGVSSGTLPGWANLDSSTGVISGTPDATATSDFTVKVTDSAASPATATQPLSITVSAPDATNNPELKGQYAFLLQGFDDATGNQFAIVGSFIADGNGNITSGLEDINGPEGFQSVVDITAGTYNVGADNRGMATLTNSLGASTRFAIAVGAANSSNVATQASLIEFDDTTGTNGKRGSGFIYLQNSNTFALSTINGPFALQFVGQTQEIDTRRVLTGAFSANGSGSVTSGVADINTNGTMTNPSFTATITADGKTTSFGRVSMDTTGIPLNYVCYIVSANRVLAMSRDNESAAGLLAGEILAQASSSFSAASLNAQSVGYGVGLLTASTGLWTFDGSSTATFSLVWNDSSFIYPGPETGSLSYSASANGRVTTSGASVALGVPGAPIFYLVDNNKGFLMSTDSSVSAGFLEPQTGGPFSNASLSGNYFFGTVPPAMVDSAVASGVGTSTGDGTLNITLDKSDPITLLTASQPLVLQVAIDSSGRGQDQDPWITGLLYMISPKKFVVLLNGRWPMITIFQQ